MKKAKITLQNSNRNLAQIAQAQKKDPISFHLRNTNSPERNGIYLNVQKNKQKSYKFPRDKSTSSDNLSLNQIDKDSCDDMRGVYIYQLGRQNPISCKLAQVPIKMKRKPMLSVKQIKQISLEKKALNCSISQIKIHTNQQHQNITRQSFPLKSNKSYHKLTSKKTQRNTAQKFVIQSPIKDFPKLDSQTRLQNTVQKNTGNICSFNNSVVQKKLSNSSSKIQLSLSKRQPRQFNISIEQSGRVSLSRPKSKSARKRKLQIIGNADDGYRRIDSIQFPYDTDREVQNPQYSQRNPRFDKNFQTISHITRIKLEPKKERDNEKVDQRGKSGKKITISIKKKY